jgi:anti-anti-sigma factor
MELEYSQLDNGICLIILIGRLDIVGTCDIETKFNDYCAGDNIRVVADLSNVNYLASIGIRLLMTVATSLKSRAGMMAS